MTARPPVRTLGRDALSVGATQLGTMALSFIVGIAITRLLGPEGRGELSLVWALATFIPFVGHTGIAASIPTLAASGYPLSRLVRTGYGLALVSVGAIGVALALGGPALADAWHMRASLLYWGWAIGLAMTVRAAPMCGLLVEGRMRARNRFEGWPTLGYVALILAGIAADRIAVPYIIAVGLIANGVVGLVATAITFRWRWRAPREDPALADVDARTVRREMWTFGWPSQAGLAAGYLNNRLDLWLCGVWLVKSQTGFYSVATTVAELLAYLPNAIQVSLLKHLNQSPNDLAAVEKTGRMTFAVMILGAIAMLVVAPYIIPLAFGPAFAESVRPLGWLLPGICLATYSKLLGAHMAVRGEVRHWMHAQLAGLAVTVVGDVYAIPRWGITGAAIVSTLAYSTSALYLVLIIAPRLGLSRWALLRPAFGEVAAYTIARARRYVPGLRGDAR